VDLGVAGSNPVFHPFLNLISSRELWPEGPTGMYEETQGKIVTIFMFLVGLLIVAVGIVLLVIGYAFLRSYLWRKGVKKEQQQAYQKTHCPDGTPLPPTARGICDCCAKCFESVFYLESGRKLCENCFHKEEPLCPPKIS
jgi:hypothetical protein